jgi:hypothetical protein
VLVRPARLFTLAILFAAPAFADPYWIFLKDKGVTDATLPSALDAAKLTLSNETLVRRELRGTSSLVTIADVPVNSSYVNSITGTGVSLRTQSSWLNAISVDATPQQLAAISALPFVDHVQTVARYAQPQALNITSAGTDAALAAASAGFYGGAESQIQQIHLDQVHNAGYTGNGVTIGILDTGFKFTHQVFTQPGHQIDVVNAYNFITNTPYNVSGTEGGQHFHGTYILGVIAGYKPNTYVGGAYNAKFLLAKTEVVPSETQVEEDYWVSGLQWLEANGADVVSSSLGYVDWYSPLQLNGHTAVTTLAANIASANGLPIVNAAGNQGHDSDPNSGHLIAPADAAPVITVGAADEFGNTASFSSDGNLQLLGALKPEVMARGYQTLTVHPDLDGNYLFISGTSLSTPLVTAAIACLIQAHPDWTVDDIRYALFSTASNANNPDFDENITGYGIINAFAALNATVPEPASITWLGIGAVLLLSRRRHRHSQSQRRARGLRHQHPADVRRTASSAGAAIQMNRFY